MLHLERLAKYYTGKDQVVKALDNINLTFMKGEFVVVTGESGSGKSTLLNVISGLDSYEDGELQINGEDTSYFASEDWENYRKKYIGFIFQRYNIIDAYSVYQNVLLALTLSGYPKKERKARALELIEAVGLTSHTKQRASKLSGGQKQRVAIARALAKDAPIIVADEPTGNLDQETSQIIMALLRDVAKDKLVILVTHDAEEVLPYATRRIRLFDGQVMEDKALKKSHTEARLDPAFDKTIQPTALLSIAYRNLRSMPRKSILTALISLFIVTVFTLTYGSYVDQESTSQTSFHPFFDALSPHRVVVSNVDGSPMSDAQLSQLRALNNVQAVVSYDPILDLYVRLRVPDESNGGGFFTSFRINHAAALTPRNLSEGRLPTAANEIVLPEPSRSVWGPDQPFNVGDTVSLFVARDAYSWGRDSDEEVGLQTFTVVGWHTLASNDWVGPAYLHDSFFTDASIITTALAGVHRLELVYASDVLMQLESWNTMIDPSLEEGEVFAQRDFLISQIISRVNPELDVETFIETIHLTLNVANAFNPLGDSHPFSITGLQPLRENDDFRMRTADLIMHPSVLEAVLDDNVYQVTLVVQDAFAARQVMNVLAPQYFSLFPYDYEDPFMAIFRVIGNIFQALSSIFLLVAMYFISYLALRNVMRSRQKDYVIMRSIGASKRDLNTVTVLELMLVMTHAFVVVYGVLWLNQFVDLGLPNYIRFFNLGNYIVALTLLLGMTFFLGMRFNRKIFNQTVQTALRGE